MALSPALSRCSEDINTRLCVSLAICYAHHPSEWADTVWPALSRTGRNGAFLDYQMKHYALHHTRHCFHYITTLRDFIYFFKFYFETSLTMQHKEALNSWSSCLCLPSGKITSTYYHSGLFFKCRSWVWTQVLMLKKLACSTYWAISQVSSCDSLLIYYCIIINRLKTGLRVVLVITIMLKICNT